jgi:hypothetical protein
MIPVALTQTGVGNTAAYTLDVFVDPFNIGFGVVVTGTVTYTVQHSFDGVNWFNHPNVVGQTANADGNYAFPIHYIRLDVSAGTGTAAMTLIQAGVNG